MRKNDLKRVTKEIFKLEPLIFHKLKQIQEKSLLGFLNLLLSSEERENVFNYNRAGCGIITSAEN